MTGSMEAVVLKRSELELEADGSLTGGGKRVSALLSVFRHH